MFVCAHCKQHGVTEMNALASHLYGFAECRLCGAVLEQRRNVGSRTMYFSLLVPGLYVFLVREFALGGVLRLLLFAAICAVAWWMFRREVQWAVLRPGRAPRGA
jgi:hypothetical protein